MHETNKQSEREKHINMHIQRNINIKINMNIIHKKEKINRHRK